MQALGFSTFSTDVHDCLVDHSQYNTVVVTTVVGRSAAATGYAYSEVSGLFNHGSSLCS